jgi:hypothetical protein
MKSFKLLLVVFIVIFIISSFIIGCAASKIDDEEKDLEEVDKQAYDDKMTKITLGIGDAITTLEELFMGYDFSGPFYIEEAPLLKTIALIRRYVNEVEEIIPPDKYKDVHEIYLKGAAKFKKSMDLMDEGIKPFIERIIIEESVELMGEGSDYFLQATEEMKILAE